MATLYTHLVRDISPQTISHEFFPKPEVVELKRPTTEEVAAALKEVFQKAKKSLQSKKFSKLVKKPAALTQLDNYDANEGQWHLIYQRASNKSKSTLLVEGKDVTEVPAQGVAAKHTYRGGKGHASHGLDKLIPLHLQIEEAEDYPRLMFISNPATAEMEVRVMAAGDDDEPARKKRKGEASSSFCDLASGLRI